MGDGFATAFRAVARAFFTGAFLAAAVALDVAVAPVTAYSPIYNIEGDSVT